MGRQKEATAEIGRARTLEPLSIIIDRDVAWHFFFQRQYDEAIAHLEKTLARDTTYSAARSLLARALAERGRYTEAIEHLRLAAPNMATRGVNLSFIAYVQARSGDTRAADATMAQVEEQRTAEYVPPYYDALVYTAEGRTPEGARRPRTRVSRAGLDDGQPVDGPAVRTASWRAPVSGPREADGISGRPQPR